jgi:hypothetical protein
MVVVKGMASELVRNWGAALRTFRTLVNHVEADPGLCPPRPKDPTDLIADFIFAEPRGEAILGPF